MAYQILESTMGPMVLHDGELVAIHEYPRMFDVIDESPTFLNELKAFITEGIERHSALALDAFKTPGHMLAIDFLQSYLNAMRTYSMLANAEYPKYRHAQQEMMKHG